ncbi:acyl carrier protein [Streptomyces sp. NBC_01498]|uniref:acyl carrier protein n=1 Tax=Streptomyces sp. NBC_01498 TaxID=2975870 RepID=UPI002E7BB501|nr:acyl carrier protein [Streptomyces sp. NBC_01498]WTL27434.1 acyl carrier protein [Streptomyces sp. NBC_01498]
MSEQQRAESASIVRIMAEVLGADEVKPSDSFYDFGGTSLQAVRICTRVKRELGIRVSPDTLLDSDTVADFQAAVLAHGETV